jgi:acetylornithine deacetylase/succinyl-diaminopimelate desuccinylase-like protein
MDLWTTPPFEPTIRDGAIYARGSADDKGQVWAHIEAIRAWQEQGGGLPVNVILLLEGEEEIGSPNLAAFVHAHRDELKADVAVISDTNQFARGLPAITYGLRGLVYEEVFLTGPSHDLHSGLFGGAVANPANVLCELVASLHDADGRVNIPGFYDDVVPLQPRERELWAKLPFSEDQIKHDLGVGVLPGEKGYTALERKWARPTCDVNGITTGFQGEGAKTVIPAKASAKVSMRLVPNQDPQKIHELFAKAIRDRCPAGVSVEVHNHSLADATLVPLGSRAMDLAADALRVGFGQEPTFMCEGGSIPVVALLKRVLGIDTLLAGFGLPDDRVHSPNEKFDLDAFYGGARTCAALYARLAGL